MSWEFRKGSLPSLIPVRPVPRLPANQTAPHFLHGYHGRLVGGGGQEAAGAILQLAGALGGDNDEPIGARLRIVRNCALRGLLETRFNHFRKSPKAVNRHRTLFADFERDATRRAAQLVYFHSGAYAVPTA